MAQLVTVTRPERVRTLTLMSTTPADPHDGGTLPGPAPQVAVTSSSPHPEPDWTDRDAVLGTGSRTNGLTPGPWRSTSPPNRWTSRPAAPL